MLSRVRNFLDTHLMCCDLCGRFRYRLNNFCSYDQTNISKSFCDNNCADAWRGSSGDKRLHELSLLCNL